MPARRAPSRVFVNAPYDGRYERLFVSLIAGLVALGRQPVCAVAAADAGEGRLRRILDLISKCDLSIHDLSRVQRARGVRAIQHALRTRPVLCGRPFPSRTPLLRIRGTTLPARREPQ